jgi:hypothetical protein
MKLRQTADRLHWLLSAQFGLDARAAFRSVLGLPRFVRDWLRFRSSYSGRMQIMPCLHDWYEEGGVTRSEYFWQDLQVARMIFESSPEKHVDIGSRVDGFVAHVASFRELEVLDIRPIDSRIPGVTFRQADLMQPPQGLGGYCDSLSCLHALEHFGLGRYGDPIDPRGAERGLANMAGLLRQGGVFYLSVPIGSERVEFNANRVFDPRTIINLAKGNLLELTALTAIHPGGRVAHCALEVAELSQLANQRYALGIFVFRKTGSSVANA